MGAAVGVAQVVLVFSEEILMACKEVICIGARHQCSDKAKAISDYLVCGRLPDFIRFILRLEENENFARRRRRIRLILQRRNFAKFVNRMAYYEK